MKCIYCDNMKIVPIDEGCGASAKCFKTSKKGKSIYWAMTTISENCNDRVIEELNRKENEPYWCPLKNK